MMRTQNAAGALCLAAVLLVAAGAPASSTPLSARSDAGLGAAVSMAVQVHFRGHRRYVGGWQPWGGVAVPYSWYSVYDDDCSGDHPPWASAYAGYLNFWCSPGFGAYYRHWPRS
jgi:hypothetical protein